MTVHPGVVRAFAESICAKVKALCLPDTSVVERHKLGQAMNDDIRRFTDLLTPEVSKAAHAKASKLGFADLRGFGWHQQKQFDPGRARFIFEHMTTVKELRAACVAAGTAEAIEKVLRSARVVWLLREEDDRLDALGFHSDRPDYEAAYQAAEIELIPSQLPADE